MAASRDLAFPLAIVCLVLIRSYSPQPTTSQVVEKNPIRPVTPHGIETKNNVFSDNDYNIYDEPVTPNTRDKVSPIVGPRKRCDYNTCLESQIPCAKLSLTGCLCPGFTLHNVVPEAPNLKSVSWNGSEVVAQWCAPLSYITTYIVTVGGEERQRFGEDKRSGGLGHVDPLTEVCVVAVNDAGDSEGSCMKYQSRGISLPMKAGLIGGALVFLLLLLLAVLLWWRKKQRKQETSISMQ
ncbi:LRRN4 C-terminal-like protein [Anoplopoma fimbria]|uniref:LRRN4 C-terminal-like protein n=1 Tax=Anoplopoma fimbria TaxID=229290 RepID=UPI0023EACB0C|nr:LRRN4 C-terminal-like protein [Anoplopoma fimbria]